MDKLNLTRAYFSRTRSNVDLFVLNKKDLDIILNSYPHIKKDIKEIAHAFKAKMDEKDKAGVVGFDVQKFKEGTTTEVVISIVSCFQIFHQSSSVVSIISSFSFFSKSAYFIFVYS